MKGDRGRNDIIPPAAPVFVRNVVTRAGKSMRNNVAKDGARIIGDANELLDGLCTQVNKVLCVCVCVSSFVSLSNV